MPNLDQLLAQASADTTVTIDTRPIRGNAVGWSKDLDRIIALPRRPLDVKDPAAAIAWTNHLRLERATPCNCKTRFPNGCITTLQPIQGWCLEEASDAGGLMASVAVGGGKTGVDILLAMAIPGVKVAVLLVPPGLKAQLLMRDYPQWSQHFKVPNLAGGTNFVPGRPTLHVFSYNEISSPKKSDLLDKLGRIDLVIDDECHSLAARKSVRTGRFLRIWEKYPEAKNANLSGTLTKKTPKDYGHLSTLALRDGSPVPIHRPTLEEWSAVLDASPFVAPTGLLSRLCEPGESPRSGFGRRLVDTLGFVATGENEFGVSLEINEREPKAVPQKILDAIAESLEKAERPDGKELIDAKDVELNARQMSAGFYYRWKFTRGETMEQIDAWLEARKAFAKELRTELQRHADINYDSPKLLQQAAIRWEKGYKFKERDAEGKLLRTLEIPPHARQGPLPTWDSEHWARWSAVHKTVVPETEPIWIDDFLVRDAAAWLRTGETGIGWYEFGAFGRAVASMAQVKFYGGGPEASVEIVEEKGASSIVASIKAHGTGKNLQYAFSRNLIMNPPSDGAMWEQLLGRTHRPGQVKDVVEVFLYRHTARWRKAFASACEKARYIQDTMQSHQKLNSATYSFDPRA